MTSPPLPRQAPSPGGTTSAPARTASSAGAPRPYGSRYGTTPVPPAQAVRHMTGFWVAVDGVQLPAFTECRGLDAEYAVETWVEGGQNEFVHQLPGRLSYSAVTLSRYVDGASGALAAWFSSVADPGQPYRTARISAVDAAGDPVARWDLVEVFASKYTGPVFSVGGTTAASESVELVHHGFAFSYAPAPTGAAGRSGPTPGGRR